MGSWFQSFLTALPVEYWEHFRRVTVDDLENSVLKTDLFGVHFL